MQTRSFNVTGMTCTGCINAVTKALNAVDGVETVNVFLASNSATIQFDEKKTDLAHLKVAVSARGYGTEDVAAKKGGCCR